MEGCLKKGNGEGETEGPNRGNGEGDKRGGSEKKREMRERRKRMGEYKEEEEGN